MYEILQKKRCLHEEVVDGLADGAIDGLMWGQDCLQVFGVAGSIALPATGRSD